MPLVSIVIPTYNRLKRLQQVLAAVEKQEYPLDDVEVVVVSDGSTDGTHAYFAQLQTPLNLVFVPQANAGPAAARNTGIQNASGEIILFIDDDVVPTPQLLAEHMRLHAEQSGLIVLGPMLNPKDFRLAPWVAWEQAMLMKQYRAMNAGDWEPTARQFYTGNTSLPRTYLLAAGGFDERFRRAEDVELAYRLQKQDVRFVFNANAIGYHYAERSFRSWFETPYAYGRNDVIFAREQQTWILPMIQHEFGLRNLLTRSLVWLCLDRPGLSQFIQSGLMNLANTCYSMGSERISQAAYSAIFNLRFYQGVTDELGGRGLFFGMVQKPVKSAMEL